MFSSLIADLKRVGSPLRGTLNDIQAGQSDSVWDRDARGKSKICCASGGRLMRSPPTVKVVGLPRHQLSGVDLLAARGAQRRELGEEDGGAAARVVCGKRRIDYAVLRRVLAADWHCAMLRRRGAARKS